MLDIVKMLSINLFQTPNFHYLGSEEEYLERMWTEDLDVVYVLLEKLVTSPMTDKVLAVRYIDESFVLKLLDLLEDANRKERDHLAGVIRHISISFNNVHGPYILKTIKNTFCRFVRTEKHKGILELLDILICILFIWRPPLVHNMEEDKLLLPVLISLNKPKWLPVYHEKLSLIMYKFVEQNPKLADNVVRGLLEYWPIGGFIDNYSSKEVLMLGELKQVLTATQADEFQSCMVPLFGQIKRCLTSSHFEVVEKTLDFWNSEHIANLIKRHYWVILPIIFQTLEKLAEHGDRRLQHLASKIVEIY